MRPRLGNVVLQTTASSSFVTGSTGSSVVLYQAREALGLSFFNHTDGAVFLKMGNGASVTDFTVKIPSGALYEVPYPIHTGSYTAVCDVASGRVVATMPYRTDVGADHGYVRCFPSSSRHWGSAFPGIPTPVEIWTMQDTSSPVSGAILGTKLFATGSVTFQTWNDPAGRYSVRVDNTTRFQYTDRNFLDIGSTGSLSFWTRVRMPDNGSTARGFIGKRNSTDATGWSILILSGGIVQANLDLGATNLTASLPGDNTDNLWHDFMIVVDRSLNRLSFYSESGSYVLATGSVATNINNVGALTFGNIVGIQNIDNNTQFSYAAAWTTPITLAQFQTIIAGQLA